MSMADSSNSNLDLALIGNCIHSALIDRNGRIIWSCLPSYDGDPMFCRLINDDNGAGGFFDIRLDDFESSEQSYVPNSAVLTTTLRAADGAAVEITDFAPRFKQFGRTYRPVMTVRIMRPVAGSPRTVSSHGAHHCGPSLPASYSFSAPSGNANLAFSDTRRPAITGHTPSYTSRPRSSSLKPIRRIVS